jgi:hypothetical protein
MSRNPSQNHSRNQINLEWGGKNRKREDQQRNLNNTARRAAIADQLVDEIEVEPGPTDYREWFESMMTWNETLVEFEKSDLDDSGIRMVSADRLMTVRKNILICFS